jgi:uncharacterized protein DUF6983
VQVIPLLAVPSQTFTITLDGQACQINVYQKLYGLFLDLYLSGTLILSGVLCENVNRIVRNSYFGFIGDLAFLDNQGATDPVYTGLGTRYSLIYLEAADLLTNVDSLD